MYLRSEKGTPAKPSEAGLVGRGETKTQSSVELAEVNANNVDLISTTWANSSAG